MKLIFESSLYGIGFAVLAFGMVIMLSAPSGRAAHFDAIPARGEAPILGY